MKIAFFGTPDFTGAFLDMLLEHGYGPSLVITNPDRPKGRGMELHAPEPKRWAQAHEVPFIQPETLTEDIVEKLQEEEWDLFVVVAYGKILPESIISLPKYGTINLHYSLLPKYRGATPVESAILSGDEVTGVSIQQMRFKLDTGPLLAQIQVPIEAHDTTLSLRARLNAEALKLFPEVLEKIFNNTIEQKEQSEDGVSYCKKIAKEDGELKLEDPGFMNDRKYRAYYGSIGTHFYAYRNGERIRVKIVTARYVDRKFIVDEVIPENGKKMSMDLFVTSTTTNS